MDKSRLRWFVRIFLLVSALLGAAFSLRAQTPVSPAADGASPSGLWREVDEKPLLAARGNITAATARGGVVPSEYRTLHLDRALLAKLLAAAPKESLDHSADPAAALTIELPLPHSKRFARFHVEESPIMQEGLAARYPDIHTYAAHGVDNPALTARLDVISHGFHAMILGSGGAILIDPYFADGSDLDTAIVFAKSDYYGVI